MVIIDIYPFVEFIDILWCPFGIPETLRISPFPFPLWKQCTQDIQLEDYDGTKVNVRKGDVILLPMYSLHNHPEYYPDAAVFRPERFDESNGGSKQFKDAGALMPFGNGPRVCLGSMLTEFIYIFFHKNTETNRFLF